MIMKICRREVSRQCIATFELADFLSNISRIIKTKIILHGDGIFPRGEI